MSGSRPAARARTLEAALWALVFLAGGFVLLPAMVELVQARQAEEELTQGARAEQEDLAERERRLIWLASDPQADEKLSERYASEDRNGGR
jgi:hypothetical protein